LKAFQWELKYKSYNHRKFWTHLLLGRTWFRLLPRGTRLFPQEHGLGRAIPWGSNMTIFMNGKGWAAVLFFSRQNFSIFITYLLTYNLASLSGPNNILIFWKFWLFLYFYNQFFFNFLEISVLLVQIRPIFLFKRISSKFGYQ
jgi:hypothetical protein